jgi:hypothetical protein
MIIPPLQGTCTQTQPFIYAACDSNYFTEFGKEFVNSIQQNTQFGTHIHLFNPTAEQLDFCQRKNVSVTHESVPFDLFTAISTDCLEPKQLERTHTAMKKGNDQSVADRLRKTYYACVRFIRLQEVFAGSTIVFAADIDAIIRNNIPTLSTDRDFYIHNITGAKARFLAGGLWLNPVAGSSNFLQDYARQLRLNIEKDYIYWGLDQDVLDPIMPKYNHGHLPISYIDWNMKQDSYVWTAKGKRKDLEVFKTEKLKYKD